jgi:predicted MFS family arabinose efflux permease
MSALVQTIVGDVIPFERRGRAMGIVMTSFSVSTVVGVPLGLYTAARWGWHLPAIRRAKCPITGWLRLWGVAPACWPLWWPVV